MSVIDILELYEQEKKVAEYYAAIGRVMRRTWKFEKLDVYLNMFVDQTSQHFDWHITAVIVKHDNRLELSSYHINGQTCKTKHTVELDKHKQSSDVILEVIRTQKEQRSFMKLTTFPPLNPTEGAVHYLAYPLVNREVLIGVLLLGRIEGEFDECETDILRDLAEHITVAMDNIKLYEAKDRYMITEERNRLAKDLHDSVNQKLFSMSLLAQGLEDTIQDEHHSLKCGLREIGQLAHESLSEMKSLIWDLRMDAEEKNLRARIVDYANKIGVNVQVAIDERLVIADKTQEVFLRIGQEALNNVRKHAGTNEATVQIGKKGQMLHMKITDHGCGFQTDVVRSSTSFGLLSMQERMKSINGTLKISSSKGKGTVIHVSAPADTSVGGE